MCFRCFRFFNVVLSILHLWKEGESLSIVLRPKKRFKFKVLKSAQRILSFFKYLKLPEERKLEFNTRIR